MNLSELSKIYYQESDIYNIFSQAEDYEDLAFQSVMSEFKNKTVLDVGCGNGKYLEKINKIALYAVGMDQSFDQIKQKSNVNTVVADACFVPFKPVFDVVFMSWVLGTIVDEKRRLEALRSVSNTLQKNGKIILFENDEDSEFEFIRNRHSGQDKNKRTLQYNNWLIGNGFLIKHRIKSYFSFKSKEEAKSVFKSIWGEVAKNRVTSNIIEHDILIFEKNV